MRRIVIGTLLMMAGCSGGEQVAGAEQAIGQFHQQLNSADYRRIYANSDSGLKTVTSNADMLKLLKAIHEKLGTFQSGTQTGWRVNYNTTGNNTVIQFDSKFEKGRATETYTFVGDPQSPRMLSYDINSSALITG
jgi:hypothetical protein